MLSQRSLVVINPATDPTPASATDLGPRPQRLWPSFLPLSAESRSVWLQVIFLLGIVPKREGDNKDRVKTGHTGKLQFHSPVASLHGGESGKSLEGDGYPWDNVSFSNTLLISNALLQSQNL